MGTDNSWLDDRPKRLGDLIDDHCPRCKRLMNHVIASFLDGKVVKVVCQTCYTEHPFLDGKEKKKPPKSTAFDQVLAKVAPSTPQADPPGDKPKAASRGRSLQRAKAKPKK